MGLGCKPFGKIKRATRKMENILENERQVAKKKELKENKENN